MALRQTLPLSILLPSFPSPNFILSPFVCHKRSLSTIWSSETGPSPCRIWCRLGIKEVPFLRHPPVPEGRNASSIVGHRLGRSGSRKIIEELDWEHVAFIGKEFLMRSVNVEVKGRKVDTYDSRETF